MSFIISDPKLARIEVPASTLRQDENLPEVRQVSVFEHTGMLTMILLLSPLAVIVLLHLLDKLFFKKLRMLKAGKVGVVVNKMPALGPFYGVPISVLEPYDCGLWAVKVVRPELTGSGSLEYEQEFIALKDLVIPKSANAEVAALDKVASVVKERFALIEQLNVLKRQCLEAEQAGRLFRSSGVYAAQAGLLEKVQHQQNQAVARIQESIKLQDKCIRERLIAARIDVFNFD